MLGEILKKNGLKVTEGRKLVLEALEDQHTPLTAEEVYQKIKLQVPIDQSTVYRILSVFSDKEITMKSIGGDGVSYYQLNNHNHGHYLVCKECHKKVMIDECPIEEIMQKLTDQTGFHITGHNLEFVGECSECRKEEE